MLLGIQAYAYMQYIPTNGLSALAPSIRAGVDISVFHPSCHVFSSRGDERTIVWGLYYRLIIDACCLRLGTRANLDRDTSSRYA